MSRHRRDKIDKLRRLASSPNFYEAARAQEAADRLSKGQPDLDSLAEGPAFVYVGHFDGVPRYRQVVRGPESASPYQLPGAIHIPAALGDGR